MLTVAVLLAAFDATAVPLFLGASLGGFVALVEMATPRHVRPTWTVGLRRFALVGLVAFGLYVAYRMALLLPPGVG